MPEVALLDTGIHNRAGFHCGVGPLDRYIRDRAAADVRKSVAVCYVLTADDDSSALLGFYTLSSLSIELTGLSDAAQRLLPKYPHVPATLIGRSAVSSEHRGQKLGELLLIDALKRALEASWSATIKTFGLHWAYPDPL